MKIARVALDVPVADAFDFRVPEGVEAAVGRLVVVPFGRQRKVGVIVETASRTSVPPEKLRALERVVDDVAPLAPDHLELLAFCARYYQRSVGEVIAASLPPRLRQVSRRPIRVAARSADASPPPSGPPVVLTAEQQDALRMLRGGFDRFQCVLLQGVTGSGKTHVYLELIAEALALGRQALFLVPEIGLTPQLEGQVRERFPAVPYVAAHSHLNEGERAAAWLQAQSGTARIVLGTRLAVLMPFAELGLVVVDEEHDTSYKQQEGVRYSARDLAVRRAQILDIPVILGSATPSLESYENALQQRYTLATLPRRARDATPMPRVKLVDTRADRPREGLSFAVLEALKARVGRGEQSLVFVNRRGFAPVLYCESCQWHSTCTRCSANLVMHRGAGELRCHHCGRRERIPDACPRCRSSGLAPVGHGTQRVEQALRDAFPKAGIVRIDRDSTARRGTLGRMLEKVRSGEIDILVGTQMLAKGHDYPGLTLVGVLNGDSGLFSADFRASERLFSLLVQVAGRAGRAERPGEVLIQTDFPAHPIYTAISSHDYAAFAREALEERRLAGFPPFGHLALLRAESKRTGEALAFLGQAARLGRDLDARVEIFDPVPASLERKAGFERAQLLVRSGSRSVLQPFLARWRAALLDGAARRIRWSLDVDPQEV